MKDLTDLALVASLLLLSLTVIYCTDAILQEMAASRVLMANSLEGTNGYEGLKPSGVKSSIHSDTAQR